VDRAPEIVIRFDRPDSDDARSLIAQLDEDLIRRYPGQPIHGLHPWDVTDPNLRFQVANVDGKAVGCGALRNLEPGIGEVKRMFVLSDFRGRGIGRQILSALEATARQLGYSTLRLETGARLVEAISLYKSSGYAEIPRYGEYVDDPFSICFEKRFA
jgi:putative acetyltransferase